MSWERRGNRYYYYHKFRCNGKVKSHYGELGQLGVLIQREFRVTQVSRRRHLRVMRGARPPVDQCTQID